MAPPQNRSLMIVQRDGAEDLVCQFQRFLRDHLLQTNDDYNRKTIQSIAFLVDWAYISPHLNGTTAGHIISVNFAFRSWWNDHKRSDQPIPADIVVAAAMNLTKDDILVFIAEYVWNVADNDSIFNNIVAVEIYDPVIPVASSISGVERPPQVLCRTTLSSMQETTPFTIQRFPPNRTTHHSNATTTTVSGPTAHHPATMSNGTTQTQGSPGDNSTMGATIAPTLASNIMVEVRMRTYLLVYMFGNKDYVTEHEMDALVNENNGTIPEVYRQLQEASSVTTDDCGFDKTSFWEIHMTQVTLYTVDPGPTKDSFVLGFGLQGTCRGILCDDGNRPLPFFSPGDESNPVVPCGIGNNSTNHTTNDTNHTDNIPARTNITRHGQDLPILDHFVAALSEAILRLREAGILQHIQASGNAFELL